MRVSMRQSDHWDGWHSATDAIDHEPFSGLVIVSGTRSNIRLINREGQISAVDEARGLRSPRRRVLTTHALDVRQANILRWRQGRTTDDVTTGRTAINPPMCSPNSSSKFVWNRLRSATLQPSRHLCAEEMIQP
jgi:hypothetical protein